MKTNARPRIVIIGGGFAGIKAANEFTKHPVDVVLIDKHNYHTFTPLLYQVATCALDPGEIAYPIRAMFRRKNIKFLMGEVLDIDYDTKTVHLQADGQTRLETYDYLIVATGTVTNFLGNQSIEQNSFALKDLPDTLRVRNHVLKQFEKAAWEQDSAKREALTTLVVVGGGPTGLETAGALYELYNFVLSKEFSRTNGLKARVVLVEALDHLLDPYPPRLRKAAQRQLEGLGVEVILSSAVEEVAPDHVKLSTGEVIHTYTLIWSAGVKVPQVTEWLDVEPQRAGRIEVKPTLEIIDRENIYAAGDITYLPDSNGELYPQMIPVAQQQGTLAAKNIIHRIQSEAEEDFVYRDKGLMATIGRRRAVAYPYYKVQLTGFIAWVTWLFLHLLWMLGFRNRLNVLVNWIWNYLTYDRSVRIILEHKKVSVEYVDDPEEKAAAPEA